MKKVVGTGLIALVIYLQSGVTAWAKTKGTTLTGASPASSLINLFLSLAVIIVLVVFTIKYLARKTQVKQTGSIEVLAARQLAANRFVEVIEVQGKRYLVGVGDQVTLLADVTETFNVNDSTEGDAPTFSQSLSDAVQAIRDKYRKEPGGGRNE